MLARRTNLLPGSIIPAAAKARAIPDDDRHVSKWLRMSREEREAYVRQAWSAVRTLWEAADVVGCHANTLGIYGRRLGLPTRGKFRRRRK
jgi:hypothetical protein